ncbi:alpha-galactosidase [Microbacterium sp. HD4P20]|uniref:glycoside hydrolase family 36 protein n=1 Tax=Microbacterium sp. HD4P20 TaxID=2864874 RepID=UPI0020A4D0CA|nr:glycoside hydrolase family 36 protein [Microbacterium sp. HD4P20]MCP2638149.1 alpha-galactosidase [Microbacterium sp. HD4P20]
MTEISHHTTADRHPLAGPVQTAPTTVRARVGQFELTWTEDSPAALRSASTAHLGSPDIGLVEVFTSGEQRGRTSQAYWRSAVGERLRVRAGWPRVVSDAGETRAVIVQHDPLSGIEVRTTLTAPTGTSAVRVENEVRNTGREPVVVTAVSSATIGFGVSQADLAGFVLGTARSEWLAENRWRETSVRELLPDISLALHGQDGRGHVALTSHGAWSSGEHVPAGYLERTTTDAAADPAANGRAVGAEALAWQVETSAGWHVDLCQTRSGGVLSLLGPTDLEHHFAAELLPGETFTAVPVALAASVHGRDDAIAHLTRYRRWLRGAAQAQDLPVVYNDFMNTLMGQPTTEALLPLVRRAAEAGAEVFCIDAGWFADPEVGDWWSTVGEWREAAARFEGGLSRVTDEIRRAGMVPGLWLEPEVVGIDSPAAATLPDEAFFQRFGRRVHEDRRYHLDLRHPAARAHLDATIDHLVEAYGIGYLKLDYNINPGAGTERNAASAGEGLLAHSRAFRDWLLRVQERHPSLRIENCSSGAMRADYSLLAVTHLQSTSDQQDFTLYPPIAASAPMSILPEQCGNWAYPARTMSDDETVFTLVTGLSGRLYVSGFLDDLRSEQRTRVAEAIGLHKALRGDLAQSTPFWPLGLPAWDADLVCLGLRGPDDDLIFVWDRDAASRVFTIPGAAGAEAIFPVGDTAWEFSLDGDALSVATPAGIGARVLRVPRG